MSVEGRFCPIPFEQMIASQGGQILTCCDSWLPRAMGSDRGEPLEELWNSPAYAMIRQSILDGSFRYCRKDLCPSIVGGTLPRKSEITDPRLAEIIRDGKVFLDGGPRMLALSADRSCNLSCPSCRTEKVSLTQGREFERLRKSQNRMLSEALPGLDRLLISGSADPFGSKIYREILTTLDGSRYPNLKIHLLTNGQLLTPRMWGRLSGIHANIDAIQVSLDAATDATYAEIRRGGRFPPLLRNLKFLQELRGRGVRFWLQLDFVVQWKNYLELPAFVRLGKELGVDRCYFQRIVNWGMFSSRAEFEQQAIYLSGHPEHSRFLEVMSDPILRDSIVSPGNLAPFINTPRIAGGPEAGREAEPQPSVPRTP